MLAHDRSLDASPPTSGAPVTWWEAVVLGFIQGATEFLPVSSSGHLVIGQALLGLRVPGISFEVSLHLATLISVIVAYWNRLVSLARGVLLTREPDDLRYVAYLVIATIPAAVVGVAFGDFVESLFDSPFVVPFGLLLTGSLLFSTRWALRKPFSARLTASAALLIGLAQSVALVPGVSRSGSTVVTALWLGIAPVDAAAFSFLMSIPAIAGAGVLQLSEIGSEPTGLSALALLLGSVTAAVVGVLAIRTFVAMLRSRSFPVFAWYCWAVGLALLAWLGLSAT